MLLRPCWPLVNSCDRRDAPQVALGLFYCVSAPGGSLLSPIELLLRVPGRRASEVLGWNVTDVSHAKLSIFGLVHLRNVV